MPNLYVRNLPQDLYRALRERARTNRRSIAAEALAVIEEKVPTAPEVKARHEFVRRLVRMRAMRTASSRTFASTEEMLREDRER